MDGTSFFSIIIFSGIIALAIVVGVVSLKFFPKTSLTKAMYVALGCISLILGVIGYFFTYSSDNTFFTAYTLFFCERFFSFRAMVFRDEALSKAPKIL